MKKLRVVQIGTEHDHAAETFDTLRKMTDCFEVLGYCPIPEDGTVKLEKRCEIYDGASRLDLEKVLSDPGVDAVVVETNDLSLTKYATLFLQKGVPVEMDKPGAPDSASFDAMMDLAAAKKIPIQLGYMYRFHPAIRELTEKIKAGELGDILYINAEMSCFHNPEKRAWLSDYPGGMMYYLGCHLLDVVLRIQGEPLEVIPLNDKSSMDGVKSFDQGCAVLRYPRGTSFVRTTAVERGGYRRRQIVAVGTKGACQIQPTEYGERKGDWCTLHSDVRYVFESAFIASQPVYTTPAFHRYKNMLTSFYELAAGQKENPYTTDYEKKLHRLILQACGEK